MNRARNRHYYGAATCAACEASMLPSDEECVRSCLDGHPEAFRHLVERYQTPLLKHLCFRLGNPERSDGSRPRDVRAGVLRAGRSPKARGVLLLALRHCRSRGQGDPSSGHAAPNGGLGSRSSRRNRPASKKRADGADRDVQEAVTRLPDTYREVILLRFFGGAIVRRDQPRLGRAAGNGDQKAFPCLRPIARAARRKSRRSGK